MNKNDTVISGSKREGQDDKKGFFDQYGAYLIMGGLVVYVILLAIGTFAEIFKIQSILDWWIWSPPGRQRISVQQTSASPHFDRMKGTIPYFPFGRYEDSPPHPNLCDHTLRTHPGKSHSQQSRILTSNAPENSGHFGSLSYYTQNRILWYSLSAYVRTRPPVMDKISRGIVKHGKSFKGKRDEARIV